VLMYYAITNVAAMRLPPEDRRYPRWIPVAGLISCLGLAFWVDRDILLLGTALIAAGLVWYFVARAIRQREG
jgi:basic amino acid/polyamine antiporter, APA family